MGDGGEMMEYDEGWWRDGGGMMEYDGGMMGMVEG